MLCSARQGWLQLQLLLTLPGFSVGALVFPDKIQYRWQRRPRQSGLSQSEAHCWKKAGRSRDLPIKGGTRVGIQREGLGIR